MPRLSATEKTITLLFKAVYEDKIRTVRQIGARYPETLKSISTHGTLLHYAIRGNATHVAQYLIAQNIGLTERNDKGQTARDLAAVFHRRDVIHTLDRLAAGKDMRQMSNTLSFLFNCIAEENIDKIEKIAAKNPDAVRGVDFSGDTLLHYAIAHNHPRAAQYLIENNIGIEAVNDEGRTARDLAVLCSRASVIRMLDAQAEKVKAAPPSVQPELSLQSLPRAKVSWKPKHP